MEEFYRIPTGTRAAAICWFRSARRLVEYRRERYGRHHLLGPALPDAGRDRRSTISFSRAATDLRRYALYGPASMLVMTLGRGVHGFTLDREIGEFVLTHPDLHIPEETSEFAINASNERFWEAPVQRYVEECMPARPVRAARISTCAGSPRWWPRCTAS